MFVKMLINFNGKEVLTTGRVLWKINKEYYLVSFYHNGVDWRGSWKISKCDHIINKDA